MREQYKHLLGYTANLITIIIDAVLFGFAWYDVYALVEMKDIGVISQYVNRGNWAVIGMYILIIYFFTQVFGGYRIGYMRVADIILSNILALILGNIVAFFELCLICRTYVNPLPLIRVWLLETIFIIIWNLIVRGIYKALYPPRKMILVHGDNSPNELLSKMNSRNDKYNISATVHYESDELFDRINSYKAVVLCDLPTAIRNDILKYCYGKGIRTYVTPKLTDVILRGADDIHMFDSPILLSRNQGLTIDQRFFKRTIDIILGLAALIITSPFMIIIALAIKLYDGGPVIYKQERYTRDGKVFWIYKFRSMRMDSDKESQRITAKNDSRVTPVGKVIRNIHFDELPQIFNILKGEMSVVGPRPEWKVTTEQYIQEIPEFHFRLKVKAGLTGYAQVWGKYNTTPYDKLKLDMMYIENYSVWLDIKILLLTVKILFQKENTEGIDDGQTTALKNIDKDKEKKC